MLRNLCLLSLLLFCLFQSHVGAEDGQDGHSSSSQKPNFVFIMTDDQDLHLDSMNYMPNVLNLVAIEEVSYQQHFCTVSICCPSRVSLLTGKLAHNTNVTDIVPPCGECYDRNKILL